MNAISKIVTLAFLACAASGSLAYAAAPNSGTILAPKRVWTERAATLEAERTQAPRSAPDGCDNRVSSNPKPACPVVAAISRSGAPVRVIQIHTVNPVAVCAPGAQDNCIASR